MTIRPVISLITAASVALHLVLGCCAHHGHAEDAAPAIALHHSHACPHGHDHGAPNSESPAEPTPTPSDCDGGQCAFLLAGKLTFDPDLTIATVGLPSLELSMAQVKLAQAELPRDWDDPDGRSVRPHLLHQVFLN
jgi:hypothetical protein